MNTANKYLLFYSVKHIESIFGIYSRVRPGVRERRIALLCIRRFFGAEMAWKKIF